MIIYNNNDIIEYTHISFKKPQKKGVCNMYHQRIDSPIY